METQHMTQQTFANFVGISPATLSSIFQGRTKPTLNTVESINSKFPNINLDWLMFGKGSMFSVQEAADESSTLQAVDAGGEQTLNFTDAADGHLSGTPEAQGTTTAGYAGTSRMVQKPRVRTDIICKEREPRRITEIRVFYDDQTWESFVPKK